MQNRGVFPYRRQGPKKRNRNGGDRRARAPQKGLPNNARDLLPMMQPATKALAQMLAGRVARSGQLGHAQAIAAQADRMISERAHNRLNPAEREEFFEQLARLKLTLADAQAEAEDQEAPPPVTKAPGQPLAQARLKEMALALAGPERARPAPASPAAAAEETPDAPAPGRTAPDTEVRAAGESPPEEQDAQPAAERTDNGADQGAAEEAPEGRLQLSATAARAAADALSDDERNLRASRRAQAARRSTGRTPARKPSTGERPARKSEGPSEAGEPDRGDASGGEDDDDAAREPQASDPGEGGSASTRRAPPKRHKQKGVPEGWVIDEEGYVVPGPS